MPTKPPPAPAAGRRLDPTSDAALLALDADYGAAPDMPVAVARRELASLARTAAARPAPLAQVGITADKVATLARFATRLGACEKAWQKARAGSKLTAAERPLLAEAEALDSKLLAGGRWACRGDREAQAVLTRIAEGAGLADTVQDLSDLGEFWRTRTAERASTDITAADLRRAAKLVTLLAGAAAKESNDLDAAAALELRNRCFWAADALSKEVREGGRYAFRLQPKIAARFTSRYRTASVRRARQKKRLLQAGAAEAST